MKYRSQNHQNENDSTGRNVHGGKQCEQRERAVWPYEPGMTSGRFASGPGMKSLARLYRLMEAGTYPNCDGVAKEFGISLERARGCFSAMRHFWKLPVAFDRKHGGYCFTKKPTELWILLAEADLVQLEFMRDDCRGTKHELALEMARDVIERALAVGAGRAIEEVGR